MKYVRAMLMGIGLLMSVEGVVQAKSFLPGISFMKDNMEKILQTAQKITPQDFAQQVIQKVGHAAAPHGFSHKTPTDILGEYKNEYARLEEVLKGLYWAQQELWVKELEATFAGAKNEGVKKIVACVNEKYPDARNPLITCVRDVEQEQQKTAQVMTDLLKLVSELNPKKGTAGIDALKKQAGDLLTRCSVCKGVLDRLTVILDQIC